MARKTRPNAIMMVQNGVSSGTTDNTIAATAIVAPADGSLIARWGIVTSAVGSGTGNNITITPHERGTAANSLADSVTFDLDGAVGTVVEASGPGESAMSATGTTIKGDYLSFVTSSNTATAITTAASFSIYVEWVP